MKNAHLESTLFSNRTTLFVDRSVAQCELEWFFASREAGNPVPASNATPAWEAIAYRIIGGWLSALDPYDASVLEAAYGTGPKPPGLVHRLGCLTGVVVRLACLEAGWPEDREKQRRLERRTATLLDELPPSRGVRLETRYVEPAAGLLRAAVRAYAHERGRGPSMVYPLTDFFVDKDS